MGIVSSENGNVSSREKELANMVSPYHQKKNHTTNLHRPQVLRLTASSLIDPTQLLSQAAIIAGLTSQRNFVIRQAEEERDRWQSERDGWERIAEALIAQRNKPGSSVAKDEVRCNYFDSGNEFTGATRNSNDAVRRMSRITEPFATR
jgi:hypothetical protein